MCYVDHVLHAKPKSPLAVRTPLQAGVELFGEPGLEADIEVISLLLASLEELGINNVTLDLGHVGLCRALLEALNLTTEQEDEFFDLLQTKDVAEITTWVTATLDSATAANWLPCLPSLCGDKSILEVARKRLADAPAEVAAAIDELVASH